MPKKLFTFCCRLCLHDGSVSQLLDIFSIKGLDEKLLKVFNIQITSRDCCTTNICLSCFQETLALEQQMVQYQKHKQTIIHNQQRLKKNPLITTSGPSASATTRPQTVKFNQSELSHSLVGSLPKTAMKKSSDGSRKSNKKKSESSPSVLQAASNKNIADGKKELNLSSNENSKIIVDKAEKRKNSPGKIKMFSANVPSSKNKLSNGSHKSISNNPESSPAVNKQQSTAKKKRTTTKTMDGGLKKQSASKKNPPDATSGQNDATKQTQPTKLAKDKSGIYINPKKPLMNDVQLHDIEINAKPGNTVVPHKNNSIISNETDANMIVPNVPDAVPTVEQNIPVQQPQSLQPVAVEDSSLTAKCSISVPVTAQSQPGIPVPVPHRQRAPSLGVHSMALQGGLCTSIPLANISTAIIPHESRAVSTAATVNQTGTSSDAPKTQGQQLAIPFANIPALRPYKSPTVSPAAIENRTGTSSNALTKPGQQITIHLANIPVTIRACESRTVSTASIVNRTGTSSNAPTIPGQQIAIPLGNISAPISPYESPTVSTVSMVNQTGTNSNAPTIPGQQIAMPLANVSPTTRSYESPTVSNASTVNQPGTSSNAPTTEAQLLTATTSTQPAALTTGQLEESRNNETNNATSSVAMKKRRHSTFIRVSSNLFDEPPEKAQFAMLNSNQFIRNIEPQTILYPRMPVLPQGHRVQIVPSPQIMMPFNTFSGNNTNLYLPLNNAGTAQRPPVPSLLNKNPTQPIARCTNFGINYGQNLQPRLGNTTNIGQQTVAGSTSTQHSSLAPNSSIRTTHSEYIHNSNISSSVTEQNSSMNRNIAPKPSNNNSEQVIRACYKCNFCNSYYLLESSLNMHLHRIHQVEKNERSYTVVYDPNVLSILMSRIRRKSIADPLQLSNNRA